MKGKTSLALLVLIGLPVSGQNSWFERSLLDKPDVRRAIQSLDEHVPAILDEWIRLVQTPAPSSKEQARAEYIRAQMKEAGLVDIRTDDLLNVSGIRSGTGGGPTVVFAAHMDTVFPDGTDVTVKRNGDTLRGPGVADDTSNLIATLEMLASGLAAILSSLPPLRRNWEP
jgi:acetylornithine deacetylase/succinyl-diaminopimelate desuccinylase-like protein